MKPEIKKKWIKALRSGEYTQGTSYLKRLYDDGSTRHCCLGVLGECINPNSFIRKGHNKAFEYDGFSTCSLQEADLETKIQDILWRMNDVEERSFSEIADYIEKNL